jgi:ligand-binding SRPBCC domain-containing protein
MKAGAEIRYELAWCFLPLRWKTTIVECKPPEYFVDQQASGPYRFWRHTRSFQVEGDGTRLFDSVEYELPFGFLGRLLHAAKGRRDLSRIFDYRAHAIRLIFSAESKMATRA